MQKVDQTLPVGVGIYFNLLRYISSLRCSSGVPDIAVKPLLPYCNSFRRIITWLTVLKQLDGIKLMNMTQLMENKEFQVISVIGGSLEEPGPVKGYFLHIAFTGIDNGGKTGRWTVLEIVVECGGKQKKFTGKVYAVFYDLQISPGNWFHDRYLL